MSPLSLIFILLVSVTIVFASESVTVDTSHCPLKGADGTYSYDPTSGKGPEDWGKKDEFHTCGDGNIQSPIDFPLKVQYAPIGDGPKPMLMGNDFEFLAGSHNWAMQCKNPGTCGYTMFAGKKFNLVNVHFHSPSEHHLNGSAYPLESHFVHATEDGEYAVIATMFEYPDNDEYSSKIYNGHHQDYGMNRFLGTVLSGVMQDREEFALYPGSLIDTSKGYCSYRGSLTTPPCTEGVTFFMSMNVETVSRRQVHTYFVSAGANYDGNNRPVQPLNNREVTCFV